MALERYPITQISGLNLYVNPLSLQSGELIRAVNVQSTPFGGKTVRPGYETFLGTADGSAVTSLFSWYKNDGTTFFLYRTSGSSLYSSAQGTGAWTITENGTISPGARFGHTVLDNTLIGGDGMGSTRHTTSGTSFSNTTLAPIASEFEQYQNRVYAMGTASDLFYSTTNDATNWNTSGTADSSSLRIPGAGKLLKIFKTNDRLIASKNSGLMYRWDGFSLLDMATELGATSPSSVAKTEDYVFLMNRLGHYGYGGVRPELLSNAIQPEIYNTSGSAIAGTAFNSIQAAVHRYDYLAAVGDLTEDVTNQTIPRAIIKYDYQKNEYLNWSFAIQPTCFHSFKDVNGMQQLIFGDATGQVYKLGGTNDNGVAISSEIQMFTHCGIPELEKSFKYLDLFFNPGCQAHVQVAVTEMFHKGAKKWIDVGDVSRGHTVFRFPTTLFPGGARGSFLFLRIIDSTKNNPYTFYGATAWFDMNQR